MKTIITVQQAADALGVSSARVKQLLDQGKLRGDKVGRIWLVQAASLNREIKRRKANCENASA